MTVEVSTGSSCIVCLSQAQKRGTSPSPHCLYSGKKNNPGDSLSSVMLNKPPVGALGKVFSQPRIGLEGGERGERILSGESRRGVVETIEMRSRLEGRGNRVGTGSIGSGGVGIKGSMVSMGSMASMTSMATSMKTNSNGSSATSNQPSIKLLYQSKDLPTQK
jgi:hypothetical protein